MDLIKDIKPQSLVSGQSYRRRVPQNTSDARSSPPMATLMLADADPA